MIDIEVADASQVADARRRAVAVAASRGEHALPEGALALAATELATNLLKHGGGGRLLVGADGGGVDLIAIDRGRGMADVDACLADGYSTAGTPGNGLGAVRRMAQAFRIVSWPARGTAVYARLGAPADAGLPAAVAVPKPGEEVSGDGWSVQRDDDGMSLLVVDGLGHGTEAALAANAAIEQFGRSRGAGPAEMISALHFAMRPTRGGAVAVARVDWRTSTVAFAGLGNIAGTLAGADGQVRRMVSHNGTAGHVARKVQAFDYPCGDGLLIMHSDGIATSWSLGAYPGLANAHPMLVAAVLYRDWARGRDDATVVVARTGRP
jgi:anti-sigma regulatory factor (Ser/Thr protein kinase)